MSSPGFLIILYALVAVSLSYGCAHEAPASVETADQPSGTRSASTWPEHAERSKGAPTPPDDDRYRLPAAQDRTLTIFLDSQTFEYLEDGKVLLSGTISSGTAADPTPAGDFRILSKVLNKTSGKYRNFIDEPTPMPYSLQFYGNYYIHEGWVTGHPESPGCIYLNFADARLLYHRMRVGDRIQVRAEGVARPANP
jgi:lipoprotein-anchoring transpeptidase ErfK/SrfK